MAIRPPAPKKPVEPPKPPISKLDKRQARGVRLICFSLPILMLASYQLYERVNGKERTRQKGEYTADGRIRMFDDQEIVSRDRQSIVTKIFGSK